MFDNLTLEELENQQRDLYNKWNDLKGDVYQKLLNYLDMINEGAPLQTFKRPNGKVDIDNYDSWKHRHKEGYKWSLRLDVEFPDPTDSNKSDFGSDFNLYISNLDLSLNHGTCGTWDKSDLGQYTRLKMMVAVFEHQDDIIRMLNEMIDMNIFYQMETLGTEISARHDQIRIAEEEALNKKILSEIVPGRYFAVLGYHWHYLDEGGCEKVYHFYNKEKIIKVSEKTFITQDPNYHWETHRRNKESYLFQIKTSRLFILNDINQEPTQEVIDRGIVR